MSHKMKFLPVVTKIKLNPEQAVLVCTCWTNSRAISTSGTRTSARVCDRSSRTNPRYNTTTGSASVS